MACEPGDVIKWSDIVGIYNAAKARSAQIFTRNNATELSFVTTSMPYAKFNQTEFTSRHLRYVWEKNDATEHPDPCLGWDTGRFTNLDESPFSSAELTMAERSQLNSGALYFTGGMPNTGLNANSPCICCTHFRVSNLAGNLITYSGQPSLGSSCVTRYDWNHPCDANHPVNTAVLHQYHGRTQQFPSGYDQSGDGIRVFMKDASTLRVEQRLCSESASSDPRVFYEFTWAPLNSEDPSGPGQYWISKISVPIRGYFHWLITASDWTAWVTQFVHAYSRHYFGKPWDFESEPPFYWGPVCGSDADHIPDTGPYIRMEGFSVNNTGTGVPLAETVGEYDPPWAVTFTGDIGLWPWVRALYEAWGGSGTSLPGCLVDENGAAFTSLQFYQGCGDSSLCGDKHRVYCNTLQEMLTFISNVSIIPDAVHMSARVAMSRCGGGAVSVASVPGLICGGKGGCFTNPKGGMSDRYQRVVAKSVDCFVDIQCNCWYCVSWDAQNNCTELALQPCTWFDEDQMADVPDIFGAETHAGGCEERLIETCDDTDHTVWEGYVGDCSGVGEATLVNDTVQDPRPEGSCACDQGGRLTYSMDPSTLRSQAEGAISGSSVPQDLVEWYCGEDGGTVHGVRCPDTYTPSYTGWEEWNNGGTFSSFSYEGELRVNTSGGSGWCPGVTYTTRFNLRLYRNPGTIGQETLDTQEVSITYTPTDNDPIPFSVSFEYTGVTDCGQLYVEVTNVTSWVGGEDKEPASGNCLEVFNVEELRIAGVIPGYEYSYELELWCGSNSNPAQLLRTYSGTFTPDFPPYDSYPPVVIPLDDQVSPCEECFDIQSPQRRIIPIMRATLNCDNE